MIIKDKAKSHFTSNEPPSQTCTIEFEEMCCICDKNIPNDAIVLRKKENGHIICIFCLVDIAQIKIK